MRTSRGILAGAAVVLATGASALAGTYTTPINLGDGPGTVGLFQGIYNVGTWIQVTADLDYNNGAGLKATRVFDVANVTPIHIDGSDAATADDQIWHDGTVKGVARARYAAYSQTFGYVAGNNPNSGSFTSVFATSGTGFAITGEASVDFSSLTNGWRWARQGTTTSTSLQGDYLNADSVDHMITYAVTNVNTNAFVSFVLMFDDQTNGGDRDFNDLVVEVQAVPIPMAAVAGLPLLGGAILAGSKRRRRTGI